MMDEEEVEQQTAGFTTGGSLRELIKHKENVSHRNFWLTVTHQ